MQLIYVRHAYTVYIQLSTLLYRRIAALEAAGAAFQTGAANVESAYIGHGHSKKFKV